jgi:pilus assembly protein CpaC
LALPSIVLKAMSKKGVIKQIAQPSIVVASGGRGEITSGGELLFQSGGQVQKFLTQNYGITVALQPKLIGKSKIVQRVDLKITHPQADPSQNAVSSLATSSLTTEVSSSSEEQILLARISQQASGKRVTKIPVIGHIPIIGELFKTREITGEDAELWITLKSQLVPSGAPQLEPFRESGEIDPNFSLLD